MNELFDTELKFKHPFTMLVWGSTGSGKTVWIRKLLKWLNELVIMEKKEIYKVMWCYRKWQKLYNEPIENQLLNMYYVDGPPSLSELTAFNPDIIIMDDLMLEIGDNKLLADLFTKKSHHEEITVIHVIQNMFPKGKIMRNVYENCQYQVFMRNRRDLMQIKMISSRLFPGNSKYFVEAYRDSTSKPYGYLVADFKNDSDEKYSLRTRIFPDEYSETDPRFAPYIYLPK
jgi:hypothetical protein